MCLGHGKHPVNVSKCGSYDFLVNFVIISICHFLVGEEGRSNSESVEFTKLIVGNISS